MLLPAKSPVHYHYRYSSNFAAVQAGLCQEIYPPFDCQRVCDGIELGGGHLEETDEDDDEAPDTAAAGDDDAEAPRNVVLVSGDTVVAAHCRYGEYADMAQTVGHT